MSTKIYEAYRFPKHKLNDFLRWAGQVAHLRIIQRAGSGFLWYCENAEQRDAWLEEAAEVAARWAADGDTEERHQQRIQSTYRRQIFSELYEPEIIAASERPEQTYFDLDASLNLWLDARYAYTIPYGRLQGLRDRGMAEWVEDFSYWNNTDQPKHISTQKWEARARKWDTLCLGAEEWDTTRLQYIAFDGRNSEHRFWLERFLCLRAELTFPLVYGDRVFTFDTMFPQGVTHATN